MNNSLERFLIRAERLVDRVEALLPGHIESPPWDSAVAFRYKRRGSGAGRLIPVPNMNLVSFDALIEVETQKVKIQNNTAQFVDGLPANNVDRKSTRLNSSHQ